MKRKNMQILIAIILLIALITGCTPTAPTEPEQPPQEEATTPAETEEEAEPVVEPETEPKETTVTFGRSSECVIVNEFLTVVDGGQFDIRKILFNRSEYQQKVERTNLQLSLHAYQYDQDSQTLEIEYRIANPSELWLYSYRDASMHLSSILETTEGQQALSLDYGYPQTVLPPKSYLYFTHRFEEIREPASAFTIRAMSNEFLIELEEAEKAPTQTFTLASTVEASVDFAEFFEKINQIENLSWDLIPFKHLTDAKVTQVKWDENGGAITLTIIPDASVPLLTLEKEHYRFQVLTDAGEVIPTEIASVEGQIDEGRYMAREPVVITLKINQTILDPCTAIQLHMVYAIPTQESRTIYLEDGTESVRDYDNMDEVSYFSDFIPLESDVEREALVPVEESFFLEALPLTEARMKSALVEELLPFFETENFKITTTEQIQTFEILEETIHSPSQTEIKVRLSISDEKESLLDGEFLIQYDFDDSAWTISKIQFAS